MPGFPRLQESYDLVVVGGGHAGLQAGLKAGLLHHSAAVLDRGPKYSRSFYAPRMDNIPGFPDGISGHALLDHQVAALRRVADRVGYFSPALVTRVKPRDRGFEVAFDWLKQPRKVTGRAVVLAMGVVDRMPEVSGKIDPIFPWANFALFDFCLFCDAHDMTGRSVAVVGHDAYTARLALELLHWEPRSVEILTHGRPFLEGVEPTEAADLRAALAARGIPVTATEISGLGGLREKEFRVLFRDGVERAFDRGFSGLGWYSMHSEIPRSLGCRFDADGYVVTDEDGRALSASTGEPIPGLYCAGDLRNGWNSIPEAWATAERAVIHAYASYL